MAGPLGRPSGAALGPQRLYVLPGPFRLGGRVKGAPWLVVACTFLFLPLGLPTGLAVPSSDGALVIEDPAGDAETVVPLGSGHTDIVRLEVGGDDAHVLRFAVAFAGPSDTIGDSRRSAGLDDVSCTLAWSYGGDRDLYHFEATFSRPSEDESGRVRMGYNWHPPEGGRHGYGWSIRDVVTFEPANETIVLMMPKEHIAVATTGMLPGAGDRLTDLEASCGGDEVDAEGKHYGFSAGEDPALTLQLGAVVAEEDKPDADGRVWTPPPFGRYTGTTVGVALGETTRVPLTITNHLGSKKIATLAVNVTDWRGDPIEGWDVQMPDHVSLPAGAPRTIDLRVTTPGDLRLGGYYDLAVSAVLLADEGEGQVVQPVRVSVPMDETRNRLWFHSSADNGSGSRDAVLRDAGVSGRLGVSMLKDDPRWSDGPLVIPPADSVYSWERLLPLTSGVRFAPESNVTGLFTVETDTGGPAVVEVTIESSIRGHIATLSGEGDGAIELKAPLRADPPFVYAGERFEVRTQVYGEVFGDPPGRVTIDPTASWIELPILPAVKEVEEGNGTWLPTLRLERGEDPTAYMNPGGRYDFSVVLGNEGAEDDEIALTLDHEDAAGWEAEIVPGAVFRLPGGDVTWVGVSLQAPEDAAEGDRFDVRLTATSRNDPSARAHLDLGATVLTTIEVEDRVYEAREDQIAPVDETQARAPGPGLVALLAVVALAALSRRRRA